MILARLSVVNDVVRHSVESYDCIICVISMRDSRNIYCFKCQSRPKASFGEARFAVYSAQNFIGRKCELVPNQSLSACMISNHNIRHTLHIPP